MTPFAGPSIVVAIGLASVAALPVIPGLNSDYLDGVDSTELLNKTEAAALFPQMWQTLVAVVPWQDSTYDAVCDGSQNPIRVFPGFNITFVTDTPARLDISSGVNAVISGQTQTGIQVDGEFYENSMDIYNLNGRVTLSADWVVEVEPGPHTVELAYRCLASALFDNSGRLIVRVQPTLADSGP